MFNSQHLASNIKKYRKLKKFSQSKFADMLGVSPQSISKWECAISVPDVENLCLISKILSVSLDALLENCSADKKLMIGVDGGGTKTEFLLFTQDGNILENIILGACNPNTVGINGSIEILTKGINSLLITNPNVSGIFIGAAGFLLGNNLPQIQSALKRTYPNIKIDYASDMLNIAASAIDSDVDCIAAICGTGSSVLTKIGSTLSRITGYGYLLSKVGSGYDIGRDGIHAVLCDIDGIGESTSLTSLIKAKLGSSVSDIIDKVYKNDASFTASMAQFVFECSAKGDAVCTRIIQENAKAFATAVNAAHKKNPHIRYVVLTGGIITCNKDFENVVRENIAEGLTVIIPQVPPVLGACVLSAKMNKIETDGLLEKLSAQYTKRG